MEIKEGRGLGKRRCRREEGEDEEPPVLANIRKGRCIGGVEGHKCMGSRGDGWPQISRSDLQRRLGSISYLCQLRFQVCL